MSVGYIIAFVIVHVLVGAMGSAIGLLIVVGAGDKLLKLTLKNFCISQGAAMVTIALSLNHSLTEVPYYLCAILGSLLMYVLILKTSMFFNKEI